MVLTDWLLRMAALGVASRPARRSGQFGSLFGYGAVQIVDYVPETVVGGMAEPALAGAAMPPPRRDRRDCAEACPRCGAVGTYAYAARACGRGRPGTRVGCVGDVCGNPNHDFFWQARGFKKRPKDWQRRVANEKAAKAKRLQREQKAAVREARLEREREAEIRDRWREPREAEYASFRRSRDPCDEDAQVRLRTGRRRGARLETSPVRGRQDRLEYGSPGDEAAEASRSRAVVDAAPEPDPQEEGSPMAGRSVHRSLNADADGTRSRSEVLDHGA